MAPRAKNTPVPTSEELVAQGFRHDAATNTWWDGEHEINAQTGKRIRRLEASPCYVFFDADSDEDKATIRALQAGVTAGKITVREGVRKKDAGSVLDEVMSGAVTGYISVMVK